MVRMFEVCASAMLYVALCTAETSPMRRRMAQTYITGIAAGVPVAPASACTAYVNFAFAAYCGATEIEAWSCTQYCTAEPGYTTQLYITNPLLDTAGYVAFNKQAKIVVVAFRGTYNVQNGLEDADALPGPYTVSSTGATYPGLVDSGFLTDYNSLASQINTALTTVLHTSCTDCQVVVVGHSLGAAMASLCAYDLAAQGTFGKIVSYTYGSPRTGNGDFVTEYNKKVLEHYRNVHRFDPVPHVPPQSNTYPYDYWHTDTEIWQDASSMYRNCASDNVGDHTGKHEQSSCSDALTAQVLVATDHMTYCGAVLDATQCGGYPLAL